MYTTDIKLKQSLSANAPQFATVGTSSAQALAANELRKGLTVVNTSSNTIYLAFGTSAVVGRGIALAAGAAFFMDEYSFTTAALNAIASGTNSNLSIQEFQ